ncbi:MAG: hypothetical protein F6J98_05545 [Moorea sp. SIO4G2]|nr:hypothetical protein [Moorena sp. SIO4G2]
MRYAHATRTVISYQLMGHRLEACATLIEVLLNKIGKHSFNTQESHSACGVCHL